MSNFETALFDGLVNTYVIFHVVSKAMSRGATIALVKEILRKGGRANWLAPSLSLPPAKGLSAFPEFPHVSVAGQATLSTKEGNRPVVELMP
jgi:hypothetical protein